MKVVTVYSDNFLDYYRIFCNSLQRCPEIQVVSKKIDLSNYSEFGMTHESWYHAIRLKLEFLLENLEDTIVFSDADIQFFNPKLLFEIYDIFVRDDLDFFCTQESTYNQRGGYKASYNTGFFIAKKGPLVENLFERAIKEMHKEKFADQGVINKLLLKVAPRLRINLKHGFIPNYYYAVGPFEKITLQTCFHHATLFEKEPQLIKNYETYFHLKEPREFGNFYGGFVDDVLTPLSFTKKSCS